MCPFSTACCPFGEHLSSRDSESVGGERICASRIRHITHCTFCTVPVKGDRVRGYDQLTDDDVGPRDEVRSALDIECNCIPTDRRRRFRVTAILDDYVSAPLHRRFQSRGMKGNRFSFVSHSSDLGKNEHLWFRILLRNSVFESVFTLVVLIQNDCCRVGIFIRVIGLIRIFHHRYRSRICDYTILSRIQFCSLTCFLPPDTSYIRSEHLTCIAGRRPRRRQDRAPGPWGYFKIERFYIVEIVNDGDPVTSGILRNCFSIIRIAEYIFSRVSHADYSGTAQIRELWS